LIEVGNLIVDQHAVATAANEAVFHTKPQSNNIPQLEAENKALAELVQYQKGQMESGKWPFRIWVVLTLLGAALFAERREHTLANVAPPNY
jgi:hypothetical protein